MVTRRAHHGDKPVNMNVTLALAPKIYTFFREKSDLNPISTYQYLAGLKGTFLYIG